MDLSRLLALVAHSSYFELAVTLLVIVLLIILMKSTRNIGPTEVGLVRKRFGIRKLTGGNAVAFNGEAGYQAKLLHPGLQFKLWPLYDVTRHPMVQIPANQIGVVASRLVISIPVVRKSATACSFPGLASSRTKNACLIIFVLQYPPEGFMR